jgi:large subunit ribosomal protein L32e
MAQKKPDISRKLLKLRKRAKTKKPEFLRSESWRYSKMSESWRRPRGLDHKMRRKIKGWPPMVSTGYKGPKIARGLHPSGLREVMVHNVNELGLVDPSVQAARIAHTVGKKKRAMILAEAKQKRIRVLNPGQMEEGEAGEVSGEGEEPVVEAEAKKMAEKPKRSLFGRKKPAEKAASDKEVAEKPKRTRKTRKKARPKEEEEAEGEKEQ